MKINQKITFNKVTKTDSNDIEIISRIHLDSLPKDILSILGFSFIKKFYSFQLNYLNSLLIKVKYNNQTVGFIAAAEGRFFLKNFIKNNIFYLIINMIVSILKNPKNLIFFVKIFSILFLSGGYSYKKSDIELQYIAVKLKGNGFGSSLINELFTQIRSDIYEYVVVKTLASTPKNVLFYQKNGFNILMKKNGRVWLNKRIDKS